MGDPGSVVIGLEVDREHVVAVVDEALGDGTADPARRPRDQRGSPLGHLSFPVLAVRVRRGEAATNAS